MNAKSILTRDDYEDYLVRLYFGTESDFLVASIARAYLDFSRTLHGIGDLGPKRLLHDQASNSLREAIVELQAESMSGEEFDTWHRSTCERLVAIYPKHGHHLYIGQAQKWINMTLKYIFALGEQRICGFGEKYQYCHVPLDNILLGQLERYNFPALSCAWSRLDNYDEYLERQMWIRRRFTLVPLDVEFKLWLGKEVETIRAG